MKTETKQSQNVHITIVPHSDAYLTSLCHLTLNHMSYSYSIHQYRVLRGLQLRVQGHHEVYEEGSNGCLDTYWWGDVLQVRIDGL